MTKDERQLCLNGTPIMTMKDDIEIIFTKDDKENFGARAFFRKGKTCRSSIIFTDLRVGKLHLACTGEPYIKAFGKKYFLKDGKEGVTYE